MTQSTSAILYELDPVHTYVGFSVRHMMVTRQRGQFHGVRGKLKLDRARIENSSVEAVIDVSSLDTHQAQRDEHLRSADFFDAAAFPEITFVSCEISSKDGGRWAVMGELTIHGVTRRVVLDAEPVSEESRDPFGMMKVGTSARTSISRKDYGMTWNTLLEAGGVAVGDQVDITLELQFQRKN